jgi:hypothetical protein
MASITTSQLSDDINHALLDFGVTLTSVSYRSKLSLSGVIYSANAGTNFLTLTEDSGNNLTEVLVVNDSVQIVDSSAGTETFTVSEVVNDRQLRRSGTFSVNYTDGGLLREAGYVTGSTTHSATRTAISAEFMVDNTGREMQIAESFYVNVNGVAEGDRLSKGDVVNDSVRDLKVIRTTVTSGDVVMKIDCVAKNQRG